MPAYFARLWALLRWGKNAGSQISPCFWQVSLQEAPTSALTTWSVLSGGQLVVLLQKSWCKKEKGTLLLKRLIHSWLCRNDSSNLLFNQDIDSLEHPFTGELVGNIGLDLKQRHKPELWTSWNDNAILSLFRWYYKSSYCLVDDSFDSSLHICRIVHIDRPHIWLSYGLGIRVLWCHLQSETQIW